MGVAVGSSVGALLAAELAGVGLSGLAQSASVVGGALAAIPATALVHRRGRRPSPAATYGVAAVGALLVVLAASLGSLPLLFLGFFLFGGATAANLQARYAAVDLAPQELRGRHLALIVWATTIGAVAGPHLAAPAGIALAPYGIPALAAPYAFSAVLLLITGIVLLALLRPDPALLAGTAGGEGAGQRRLRDGLTAVLARPPAILGITAVAVGHMVMVGIMAMTPVHIRGAGHDAAHTLRIVGVVISVHIAGMYAFAPVIGWLTDRIGRRPVIVAGIVLLLTACALAGGAGYDNVRLSAGLFTVGLGWSCTMVAGSTLLTETVPVALRASAQGLSDLIMGLAGASAGALSGVVMSAWEYSGLAWVAALATVPLALLLLSARKQARSISMRTFVIVASALVFSSALAAQTRYKFAARETLRYHEVTTIAIAQDSGDTLKAWYERLASFAQQPLTARDVVERIKQNIGVPWTEPTVDTFKDGDSTTRVTGIAVTMMATFDVLKRAQERGANLVITHEPTFYDHFDKLDVLESEHDSVTAMKRAFIRTHGMVVVRMHDHWHRRRPEPMATDLAHKLGWDGYRSPVSEFLYRLPETTLGSLAATIRRRLPAPTLRVVGDSALRVTKIAITPGAAGFDMQRRAFRSDAAQVLVIGEGREWEIVEYAADAVTAGQKKALIVLGHVPSEQDGMEEFARWLGTFVKEVPITFVPTADPFWAP
jgi:MFS family permease/putative NIF3 family GTP cyclohydrolase 1 type 2